MTNEDNTGYDIDDDNLVRLEDVAKIANVSISTVSRALNDSKLVSDRTKKKIRAIVEANNMSLRKREEPQQKVNSRTLELVIPEPQGREARISDAFYLDLIGAIGDALKGKECDLLISHHTPYTYQDLVGITRDGRADAYIMVGQSLLHEHLNTLAETNAPFVVWGAQLEGQKYCSIGSDNERGGYLATSHLARMGRRNICFIGDVDAPEVGLRFEGYKRALDQQGLVLKDLLVRSADFALDAAMETIENLIEEDITFDGVVAASDVIAMGAIRALHRRGIEVPGDVSIIGYDDVQLAAYSTPALTTIRQDVARAGHRLVSKALRMAEGEKMRSELLPTELIVRESCGA
jgi:DNA-binding LacI/PurR family transcriptional regulator